MYKACESVDGLVRPIATYPSDQIPGITTMASQTAGYATLPTAEQTSQPDSSRRSTPFNFGTPGSVLQGRAPLNTTASQAEPTGASKYVRVEISNPHRPEGGQTGLNQTVVMSGPPVRESPVASRISDPAPQMHFGTSPDRLETFAKEDTEASPFSPYRNSSGEYHLLHHQHGIAPTQQEAKARFKFLPQLELRALHGHAKNIEFRKTSSFIPYTAERDAFGSILGADDQEEARDLSLHTGVRRKAMERSSDYMKRSTEQNLRLIKANAKLKILQGLPSSQRTSQSWAANESLAGHVKGTTHRQGSLQTSTRGPNAALLASPLSPATQQLGMTWTEHQARHFTLRVPARNNKLHPKSLQVGKVISPQLHYRKDIHSYLRPSMFEVIRGQLKREAQKAGGISYKPPVEDRVDKLAQTIPVRTLTDHLEEYQNFPRLKDYRPATNEVAHFGAAERFNEPVVYYTWGATQRSAVDWHEQVYGSPNSAPSMKLTTKRKSHFTRRSQELRLEQEAQEAATRQARLQALREEQAQDLEQGEFEAEHKITYGMSEHEAVMAARPRVQQMVNQIKQAVYESMT